jgi:hypothetical protein
VRCWFLLLLLIAVPTARAACHCVTPAGSGTFSGADWSNALKGFTAAPNGADWASLMRGDTYYLARGTYAPPVSAFTVAGSTVITITVATGASGTPGPHCTDTGWNQGTLEATGANPARIQNDGVVHAPDTFAAILGLTDAQGLTIDGLDRTGARTGYRFVVDNSGTNAVAVPIDLETDAAGTLSSNLIVRFIEIVGAGLHVNCGEAENVVTSSGTGSTATLTFNPTLANSLDGSTPRPIGLTCGGQTSTLAQPRTGNPWVAGNLVTITGAGAYNCTKCSLISATTTDATHATITYSSAATGAGGAGGSIQGWMTQQDVGIRVQGNSATRRVSNVTIHNIYSHDSNGNTATSGNVDTMTVDGSTFTRSSTNPIQHASTWDDERSINITFKNNVFEDSEGSGFLTQLNRGGTTTASNWNINGNVFLMSSGNTRFQTGSGDGPITILNSLSVDGWNVWDNSFINLTADTPCCVLYFNAGALHTHSHCWNNLAFSSSANFVMDISLCQNINGATNNTEGDNSFLNTGSGASCPGGFAATDTCNASGSANPFVNWPATDFHLSGHTQAGTLTGTYWNGSANTSGIPPSDATDPDGVTRVLPDRGAYDFVAVGGTGHPDNAWVIVIAALVFGRMR